MGTKRRKGAELPVESSATSLPHAATEHLPPAKVPRMAVASAVPSAIQEFNKASATMDDKLTSEKATLERRLAVLQHDARHKDQSDAELRHLREQLETMKNSVTRLHASEEQVARRNATLRDSATKLEIQLEEAQKLNAQLKLELKAREALMEDQSRHYEDKKHELEHFYEKKGMDEDKRKQVQLAQFQEKLSKAREDIASLETKSRTAIEQSEQMIRTQMKKLETELQESSQKVGVEGGVRQILEDQVRELRTEHVAVNAQMEAVKAEMKRLQSANVDSKEQHDTHLVALEARFQQERDDYRCQIDKLQEEKVSLESAVKTLRERASTVRDGDLEELCEVKREADVLRRRLNELTSQGAQSIAQKDILILELQEKVKKGDKMRRALHNTIQVLELV
ncbi:hypothetical protein G195_007330 [Phytophthora kernoviae 00238/432]|uniref:Uncharacterized protein n=1 Tax=Phytophthora kernoviae 00238/432 TaxID=1284355 RepID=A0A8J4WAB1_9STRA|nr:hypothetical protein G195_007330 [Phytophthora kernoviae 00238/432]